MKKSIALLFALLLPITALAEKPAAIVIGEPLRNSKGEEVFLFDWYQQSAFKKRWHEQVGKHTPKIPMYNWVRKMEGPSPALEGVLVNQKMYYYTTICQPHNCPSNRLYILTDTDKQRIVAYHVVHDDDNNGTKPDHTYVYGKPTAAELDYLKAQWLKEQ